MSFSLLKASQRIFNKVSLELETGKVLPTEYAASAKPTVLTALAQVFVHHKFTQDDS